MSSTDFDPGSVHCSDWVKISPSYRVSTDCSKCSLCGANPASVKKCGGCLRVAYCCTDHQKEHWKKGHKSRCSPFKIVTDSKVGRFVVATRNIKAGEVIFEELPITAGPKQFTGPVCLGCYRPVDGSTVCETCRWPVCQKLCSEKKVHKVECKTLAGCRFKPKLDNEKALKACPIYECLTPLRCVLIKNLHPGNWEVLKAMEQHREERQREEFYQVNQTNTVRFIQDHMSDLASEVTSDDINAAIDVLDVNAFEIRGRDFSVRGVFPLTAMMNSVCSPNTQNCIDSDFTCRVRASVDIPRGEEVTTSYTHTLAGTAYRRGHLRESKYFDCDCRRCRDPTELGSHFSTLVCQNDGCGGLVVQVDPLDYDSGWKCYTCFAETPGQEIKAVLEETEREVESLANKKEDLEEKILALSDKLLHRNHNIILDMKFTLVNLYGRERLEDDQLLIEARRKRQLCTEVIDVMDLVIPGRFRLRGMFLFELYVVSLYLLKRKENEGKFGSEEEARLKMEELKEVIEESIEILSYEPEDSLEGQRAELGRQYLRNLKSSIAKIKAKGI